MALIFDRVKRGEEGINVERKKRDCTFHLERYPA